MPWWVNCLDNPFKKLYDWLRDILEKDVVRIVKVDPRYSNFDDPEDFTLKGKLLEKTRKSHKTVKVGPSNYILVPFAENLDKSYLILGVLEPDGRRTMVCREDLQKHEEGGET